MLLKDKNLILIRFIFQPFKHIWELLKTISNHVIWLFLSVLVENARAYGSYNYGGEGK